MANNGPFYAKGRYVAEVLEQALGKAQTGTVQFVMKVKILSCLTPVSDVEQQYDRTIFLAITEKTMEYVVPKLQGIGYTRDSLKFLDANLSNHHSFVGQQIEVFCNHENDREGHLREKWDIAKQGSKPLEVTPVESSALRSLDMLFGRAVKQSGGSAATAKPKPQPVAAPDPHEISDDDFPAWV